MDRGVLAHSACHGGGRREAAAAAPPSLLISSVPHAVLDDKMATAAVLAALMWGPDSTNFIYCHCAGWSVTHNNRLPTTTTTTLLAAGGRGGTAARFQSRRWILVLLKKQKRLPTVIRNGRLNDLTFNPKSNVCSDEILQRTSSHCSFISEFLFF